MPVNDNADTDRHSHCIAGPSPVGKLSVDSTSTTELIARKGRLALTMPAASLPLSHSQREYILVLQKKQSGENKSILLSSCPLMYLRK